MKKILTVILALCMLAGTGGCGKAEALLPGRGDALIVPALCCDEGGYRLGQGGGYYDRLLSGCRAVSICLCRERLLRKKIPREWNDLAVDIVVTEERALRIK